MKPIIAPSILSADFAYLAKDLEMVTAVKPTGSTLTLGTVCSFLIYLRFPGIEVCGKTVKEAFGCTSDDCATREIH